MLQHALFQIEIGLWVVITYYFDYRNPWNFFGKEFFAPLFSPPHYSQVDPFGEAKLFALLTTSSTRYSIFYNLTSLRTGMIKFSLTVT